MTQVNTHGNCGPSLAKPDPSAAHEGLVASLYHDLYPAAEILQSNQIAERAITKFWHPLYTVAVVELWEVHFYTFDMDTERVREAARELSYTDLRQEQLRVVEVLPTGYGKSLCYVCLPIVFDKLLAT